MKPPIPENIALEICELVRERNKSKKLSLAKGQCWGCMKFSIMKSDVKARCIFSTLDNRGCQLVNKIFDNENYNLK
ncbi:MAG: hypothetical protein ACFFKA_20995 [Candidatus Thorarchaeota archaeon]